MGAVAAAAFSVLAAGAAQATVVDFNAYAAGAQANPLTDSGATFTTAGGFNYVGPAFDTPGLCASTSSASNADCSLTLEVGFAGGASGLSFNFTGNNETGIGSDIGDVQLFAGATLLGTVNLIVLDGNVSTKDLVSLAGFSGVTRMLISTTDFGGLILDDFTFTLGPAGAPEPGVWALMIAGFGLAGAALRRRRAVIA